MQRRIIRSLWSVLLFFGICFILGGISWLVLDVIVPPDPTTLNMFNWNWWETILICGSAVSLLSVGGAVPIVIAAIQNALLNRQLAICACIAAISSVFVFYLLAYLMSAVKMDDGLLSGYFLFISITFILIIICRVYKSRIKSQAKAKLDCHTLGKDG